MIDEDEKLNITGLTSNLCLHPRLADGVGLRITDLSVRSLLSRKHHNKSHTKKSCV